MLSRHAVVREDPPSVTQAQILIPTLPLPPNQIHMLPRRTAAAAIAAVRPVDVVTDRDAWVARRPDAAGHDLPVRQDASARVQGRLQPAFLSNSRSARRKIASAQWAYMVGRRVRNRLRCWQVPCRCRTCWKGTDSASRSCTQPACIAVTRAWSDHVRGVLQVQGKCFWLHTLTCPAC